MAETPFVFISYARADREPVSRVVEELRRLGVHTWVDADRLVAGDSWQEAIGEALRKAKALVVFISATSMKSAWIAAELDHALENGARVVPVMLEQVSASELPLRLRAIQWLDATKFTAETAARRVAEEISKILNAWANEAPASDIDERQRVELAKAFVAQSKDAGATSRDDTPRSVFVVHGHDDEFLREVIGLVEIAGIRPIVLKEVGGAARSLIDKFFEIGGAARFAIVLLSADDFGASREQFEEPEVGERALKFRSRQNVILELGYFYGLLGWDNVFVLERPAPKKFPDFERPSDLNGVVFDRYDMAGKWKGTMLQRLKSHGFEVDVVQS